MKGTYAKLNIVVQNVQLYRIKLSAYSESLYFGFAEQVGGLNGYE